MVVVPGLGNEVGVVALRVCYVVMCIATGGTVK